MDRWIGKVAVVTGASTGIGATVAEALVNAGIQVVGLARGKEKLEELSNHLKNKKGKFHPIKVDVTEEYDVVKAFEWIRTNVGTIHILINSAGTCKPTTLIDGDAEAWKQTLDTNVIGLTLATREAAKYMMQDNVDGQIIHVNSTVGHFIPPGATHLNVYAASKYAVTALAETLRQELAQAKSKIKVTSLSPGGVRTNIDKANGIKNSPLDRLEALGKILFPKDVADVVMFILSTPPHVQVQELMFAAF